MANTEIQNWIQPISTSLGAAIALITAILVVFLNQRHGERKEEMSRQRERLEVIYALLNEIGISSKIEAAKLGKKVLDFSIPLSFNEHEYVKTFLKAEMLISLYFKDLSPLLIALKDEVTNFIAEANHVSICDYARADAYHKEEICGHLDKWATQVEEKASSIKMEISLLAKV